VNPRPSGSPLKRTVAASEAQEQSFTLWQPIVIILAVLIGAAWFLAAEHEIAGQPGFPLDDSWIYATFARNLATGHGYAFNPGEQIAGATGPLYVFVLGLLYLTFHDVIWPAKVLGILCLCASSLVLYRAVHRILPGRRFAPLLAGLLLALSPPLLWGSLAGLELPLYLLLACLGIDCYVREKWTWAILCWALGVWLRPDGLFLVLLGQFVRPKISIRNSIGPLAAAGLIVGTYLVFNYVVGQRILPTSVGIKAHLGGNVGGNEWSMLKQWADLWGVLPQGRVGLHVPLFLAGIIVGSYLCLRVWPALVAYCLLFPFVFALFGTSGGQFGRYIVYVVPFGVLLALVGFDWASRRLLRRNAIAGLILLGFGCLAWEGYTARKAGIGYGWNVENINGMQRFIAESTRKATSPGDTVAVNDVGAMGFFSDCYVVDLVGLVSPQRPFPESLRLYHPKYMAIFPDWFEKFATIDWKTNQVVFYDADSTYKYSPFLGVGLKRNTISSRNTMYIYERMGRDETGVGRVPIVAH